MSDTPKSYYQRHIFFCLNKRDNGEACCVDHDAQGAFDHCKSRAKKEGLMGPGKVRVNKAGCLDRCAGGPICVVYPEAPQIVLESRRLGNALWPELAGKAYKQGSESRRLGNALWPERNEYAGYLR